MLCELGLMLFICYSKFLCGGGGGGGLFFFFFFFFLYFWGGGGGGSAVFCVSLGVDNFYYSKLRVDEDTTCC